MGARLVYRRKTTYIAIATTARSTTKMTPRMRAIVARDAGGQAKSFSAM